MSMFGTGTQSGGISPLILIAIATVIIATMAWHRWGSNIRAWLGIKWWAAGWSGQGWNKRGVRRLGTKLVGLTLVAVFIGLVVYRRTDKVQARCEYVQIAENVGQRPPILDSIVCEIP